MEITTIQINLPWVVKIKGIGMMIAVAYPLLLFCWIGETLENSVILHAIYLHISMNQMNILWANTLNDVRRYRCYRFQYIHYHGTRVNSFVKISIYFSVRLKIIWILLHWGYIQCCWEHFHDFPTSFHRPSIFYTN